MIIMQSSRTHVQQLTAMHMTTIPAHIPVKIPIMKSTSAKLAVQSITMLNNSFFNNKLVQYLYVCIVYSVTCTAGYSTLSVSVSTEFEKL